LRAVPAILGQRTAPTPNPADRHDIPQLRHARYPVPMRTIVAIFLCGAISTAHAQIIVDRSDAGLPPDDVKIVLEGVAAYLRDPASAQVRGLRRVGNTSVYCGEVNPKKAAGEFRLFAARAGLHQLVIFQSTGDDREFDDSTVFLPLAEVRKQCDADAA
jgi:hypothetical protein